MDTVIFFISCMMHKHAGRLIYAKLGSWCLGPDPDPPGHSVEIHAVAITETQNTGFLFIF